MDTIWIKFSVAAAVRDRKGRLALRRARLPRASRRASVNLGQLKTLKLTGLMQDCTVCMRNEMVLMVAPGIRGASPVSRI